MNLYGLQEELLPFYVQMAHTDYQLQQACDVRKMAYGKHLSHLSEYFARPDDNDYSSDFAVLIAKSKLDDRCIGTVRIQITEKKPLCLEDTLTLPSALRSARVAEISRLALQHHGAQHRLRLMLIKSAYWYCRHHQVNVSFICVRHPVDRQYREFGLDDVFPNAPYYPMKHIGQIPHRVLWFDTQRIGEQWVMSNHPLKHLFLDTYHPDILNGIHLHTLLLEEHQRKQPPRSKLLNVVPRQASQ